MNPGLSSNPIDKSISPLHMIRRNPFRYLKVRTSDPLYSLVQRIRNEVRYFRSLFHNGWAAIRAELSETKHGLTNPSL